MTYGQALAYLKQRFGDAAEYSSGSETNQPITIAKISVELITTDTGYCTGIIFKVGRSKHTVCGDVNEKMLRLFADGIEYARNKRSANSAVA